MMPDDANTPASRVARVAQLRAGLHLLLLLPLACSAAPLLRAARRGALNMHGSLLPKYRGRAPVNWAILRR